MKRKGKTRLNKLIVDLAGDNTRNGEVPVDVNVNNGEGHMK